MVRNSGLVLQLSIFIALVVFAAAGCSKNADTNAASTAEGAGTAAAPSLHDNGPVGDPAAGEKVYSKTCVACHQADGTGNGGMLAANFKKDKTRLAKPDSALYKSISEGLQGKVGVMPAQKDALSEQEIKDVIAYVRATFSG